MTLKEAVQSIAAAQDREREFRLRLVIGFTPLHLETMLTAELAQRLPTCRPVVECGTFGDYLGNLARAAKAAEPAPIVSMLEWADLDARLGWREGVRFDRNLAREIVRETPGKLRAIADLLKEAAARACVVLSPPTLPLPPLASTPTNQASSIDFGLRAALSGFLEEIGGVPSIRIVNDAAAELTAGGQRLDLRSDFAAGFPYRLEHAAALAKVAADLLQPVPPVKGIITDLDETLWSGIAGEVGLDALAWDLNGHARAHGLYQQLLQVLAHSGTLIGVASRNDPALVDEILRKRRDLLVDVDNIFPVCANWGPKSLSVAAILRAWNIDAADVVFVDDSALELAEVAAAFPRMQTLQFPGRDGHLPSFLLDLRDRCGKTEITAEDGLRMASIRSSQAAFGSAQAVSPANQDSLLAEARQALQFAPCSDSGDSRPLDLINKTNQFNLNGRRCDPSEWRQRLARPDGFAIAVSYEDKYGQLGRISTISGRHLGRAIVIDTWVLSCRAFTRRIEFAVLDHLFNHFVVDEIAFEYVPTDRNGPIRDFLDVLGIRFSETAVVLTKRDFERRCPSLYHRREAAASVGG